MRSASDFVQMMDEMFTWAGQAGVLFRATDSEALDGRTLRVEGRELINFGSCSYLGLELDERLKAGAIDAIQRYGTQFSSSRGYMALPLYGELEGLFETIFGLPALVAPTTTLGHAAALPLLVDEADAVILDQQVHHSVQQSVHHVRVQGVPVEVVRHNRMDLLEERIVDLSKRHRRVWYLADGIYSMFGDVAPMEALHSLLERHERFHLYVDDAHGMSWYGQRGKGYALELVPHHARMVVATSLAKAFGVGGGVLILPDAERARKLKTVGSSFTFSGPLQPANLGAAVVSARLHASGEVEQLQAELRERLQLCNRLCREYGLPLFSPAEVPIRFIAAGQPAVVFKLVPRLIEEGFYTNGAMFPAVPMSRAGLRFTLTRHQTPADIEALIAAIAHHLPLVLEEEGSSLDEVFTSFGLPKPERAEPAVHRLVIRMESALMLAHHDTIEALDPAEWDAWLGANGTFTWEGLRDLEATFKDHPRPETRWKFHYYTVRDRAGAPVLATFFTEALWKDDMLASAAVSARVEERRKADPHYLTSWTLSMGSLLTEGQHLWLDRDRDWRGALTLLLREVGRLREACGASTLLLRDLPTDDRELGEFLLAQGFARFEMPPSYEMDLEWPDAETYLASLPRSNRRTLRKKVLRYDGWYDLEVLGKSGRMPDAAEVVHLYGMYRAVAAKNQEINCFDLPLELFAHMLASPCWEILLLRLKPEHGGGPAGTPAAFTACFRGPGIYVPHVCGLDYRYVEDHGAYRQLGLQPILRALREGYRRVYMGFSAGIEKERVGCRPRAQHVYVEATNDYQLGVLRELMLDARTG